MANEIRRKKPQTHTNIHSSFYMKSGCAIHEHENVYFGSKLLFHWNCFFPFCIYFWISMKIIKELHNVCFFVENLILDKELSPNLAFSLCIRIGSSRDYFNVISCDVVSGKDSKPLPIRWALCNDAVRGQICIIIWHNK